MFEARFQTYWADVDAAGIVYFPHFFKYVEQAEEELFRSAGHNRQQMIEQTGVWMPRVEAFSKFIAPIKHGAAIRVVLKPEIQGQKTIRYNFEIVEDATRDKLAEGYITVVCVDRSRFKATPIPDRIKDVVTRKWR